MIVGHSVASRSLSQGKPHMLTLIEAMVVLQTLTYPEHEAALMSMTTGMRIDEICELRWMDINLTSAATRSRGQVVPSRHALVRAVQNDIPKGGSFSGDARLEKLSDVLLVRLEELRWMRPHRFADAFVLARADGSHFTPDALSERLNCIGRELQMPWLSWDILQQGHHLLIV